MTKFLNFPFELKSIDENEGTIEGYASTFGNMDLGFDIVDQGAFKKTLKENKGKVPILADHNPSKQIGWNMTAEEDSKGLWVTGKLDIANNALARERFSLVKTAKEIGATSGLSIGYMTIKAEPDSMNPSVRRLKELRLFEYSLVTFPMNTEAMVTAAKNWTLNPSIENLVEAILSKGYSLEEVQKVLASRATTKTVTEPDVKDIHSMTEQLERLSKIFGTK
jgi:HK97 family phage prohead protease